MRASAFGLRACFGFRISGFGFGIAAVFALLVFSASLAPAQDTNSNFPIDLPTALRLAGAQNLDVKLAREKLAEAKALHTRALWQFFPWLAPGIAYRRHDNLSQDTPGNILDVHRDSYAPGGTLAAQVDLGDAIYKSLASKQLVKAADLGLEAQRQESVLAAAGGYFELAQARAAVGVAREAVQISSDYGEQLQRAVEAGIAFKGDRLRVEVQTERDRLALRQAEERQRLAGARLAQVLHLDPAIALVPQESELVPLALVETNAALDSLVKQTLATRPELQQRNALTAAARESRKGAVYGPLIPSVGAGAFFGGLGGGKDGSPGTFGAQEDYFVGLSWRIGPGGLFDVGRTRQTESQLRYAHLDSEKVRDEVTRQVVDAFTRWQSQSDQLAVARRALASAEEGLRLAEQRKEFAVGVVLENIQARQDVTRTRLDYLKAVTEFNQAQYALLRALGKL